MCESIKMCKKNVLNKNNLQMFESINDCENTCKHLILPKSCLFFVFLII